MYVGIISDTHGIFDDKLKAFLDPVDVIWHAGDFGTIAVADQLAAFKPLIGVHGNCDGIETRVSYPLSQVFEAEELKVAMTHIGGFPGKYDYDAFCLIARQRPDIFVCGHSHILRVIRDNKFNMLTINPGAAGLQGIHKVRTAIRVHIDGKEMHDMEVGEWERVFR